VDLEQPCGLGGSLDALGDHLSNLSLLSLGELRAASADAIFLACGIIARVGRAGLNPEIAGRSGDYLFASRP
jgi:hypothetical protein